MKNRYITQVICIVLSIIYTHLVEVGNEVPLTTLRAENRVHSHTTVSVRILFLFEINNNLHFLTMK